MPSEMRGLSALPMLASSPWQMSFGERAALEGVVSQLRPTLALEIGTAEGGSLRRIAAHSKEVHSFDLVAPSRELARLPNVTFHTGDSHQLLPQVLEGLAAAGRSIEFVLVDGDHSAAGVRRDLEDILRSTSVRGTVVLLHDTMNPDVREGIESVEALSSPKVSLVELDLVPGYLARREPYRLQLWGGLGLVAVDAERPAYGGAVRDDRFHELFAVLRPTVDLMIELESSGAPLDSLAARGLEERLRAEILWLRAGAARSDRAIHAMESSLSWRVTEPLRRMKRSMRSS
ncbi:MAG: class I SAM-dependent methyltransferase [Solirubrobacteraceae bacterium]